MNAYSNSIAIKSNTRFSIIDITDKINETIEKLNITTGIVNIFSYHSTSSIIINENEEGLIKDMENTLKRLIPDENRYYHDNIDNNADSHIRSMLLSPSESIPVKNRKLALGTWQSVFFIDFDGPRSRTVEITVLGK
ncbi:secondary thiamine-phosphate synthase enzyme YjbQ [Methanobrevibacter filiformis]|uniref:Secondary thiamine-phosphate synthase enzyme n=1 Tax=Methanobrevibacter filiformis TaxID=55758 RepID=A0A165Z9J7_9EURY|nr:secondary thiamine-phosphate synthase enzyme YjbQ [Methanobrevibacter filiformis]KZX10438.1 hypothetical protein MBFIL_17370 [Methanobrevibacter filiformis]